jgi:hypothetical protein
MMLDPAELPDDVATLKAMVIAAERGLAIVTARFAEV